MSVGGDPGGALDLPISLPLASDAQLGLLGLRLRRASYSLAPFAKKLPPRPVRAPGLLRLGPDRQLPQVIRRPPAFFCLCYSCKQPVYKLTSYPLMVNSGVGGACPWAVSGCTRPGTQGLLASVRPFLSLSSQALQCRNTGPARTLLPGTT